MIRKIENKSEFITTTGIVLPEEPIVQEGLGFSRLLSIPQDIIQGVLLPYLFDRECEKPTEQMSINFEFWETTSALESPCQKTIAQKKLETLSKLLLGFALCNKKTFEIVVEYIKQCANSYCIYTTEGRQFAPECLRINGFNAPIKTLMVNGLQNNSDYLMQLGEVFKKSIETKYLTKQKLNRYIFTDPTEELIFVLKSKKTDPIGISIIQYLYNILLSPNYSEDQKGFVLALIEKLTINKCFNFGNKEINNILITIIKEFIPLITNMNSDVLNGNACAMINALTKTGMLKSVDTKIIEGLILHALELQLHNSERVFNEAVQMICHFHQQGLLHSISTEVRNKVIEGLQRLLSYAESEFNPQSIDMLRTILNTIID